MSAAFPTENPSWELESIFAGGIESTVLREEVSSLERLAEDLRDQLHELSTNFRDETIRAEWKGFFDDYFELVARCSECRSFCHGMASTYTDDARALRMPSLTETVTTAVRALDVQLQARFRHLDNDTFEALLRDPAFGAMEIWLCELRRDADQAMDSALEELTVELNRDGLHAWGRLYNEVSGRLKVPVTVDGEEKEISVGQAQNMLEDPEQAVRKMAYEGLRAAWSQAAPVCASALNSIIGAEQALYRRRGGDCLTAPLQSNRVKRSTVEAMMAAACEVQPLLGRYLKAKARFLGEESLHWYDRHAPLGVATDPISYEKAQTFIVEQIEAFSPPMAAFYRMALANQWVEVEDRSGKAQGGYCTGLPVKKEFRIFMTFGGTNSGVTTLAHELGHGYHFWVMKDLPLWDAKVPMGLAETASTLAEALVDQAAIQKAEGDQKFGLLDERLNRAVAFLMDIPARFELELAMHEHRANGNLHEELLRGITSEIYARNFAGSVTEVDDLFWASKLHFFLTDLPFYNFPYTFGYLFSRAVYNRSQEVGPAFLDTLDDLLRESGRLTSEELARKYLEADLGEKSFWLSAIGDLEADVDLFVSMVDARVETTP